MLTPGDGQVTLGWIVTTGHWTPALEFTTDVYRDGALIEFDRFVDDEVSNGESYEYQVVAVVEGGEAARSPRMTAHVGNHYDTDGDNLIEIGNLEQLNALRWDLDGNGLVDASANKDSYGGADGAFPGAAPGMGCNETVGCKGYELKEDLDSPTPIATPAKSTPLGRTRKARAGCPSATPPMLSPPPSTATATPSATCSSTAPATSPGCSVVWGAAAQSVNWRWWMRM